MPLADVLEQHYETIRDSLRLVVWDDLLDRLRAEEASPTQPCCPDEQLWTFLVACGYAVAGVAGVADLTFRLTGQRLRPPRSPQLWFEFRPLPPRFREGTTYLDLAVGDIAQREGTQSGIRLDDQDGSWACFAEMKWYADLSLDVTHDVERNQLARVAENVVCFQGNGHLVETAFLVLVTPAVFRPRPEPESPPPFCRLYQYKFQEYERSDARAALLRDIQRCPLPHRQQADWHYLSDLAARVASLKLRWVTYDELFQGLPVSPVRDGLMDFWQQRGRYQGRL